MSVWKLHGKDNVNKKKNAELLSLYAVSYTKLHRT